MFGRLSKMGVVIPRKEDTLHNPDFLPLPTIFTNPSSTSPEHTFSAPTSCPLSHLSKPSSHKALAPLHTRRFRSFKKVNVRPLVPTVTKASHFQDSSRLEALLGMHYIFGFLKHGSRRQLTTREARILSIQPANSSPSPTITKVTPSQSFNPSSKR